MTIRVASIDDEGEIAKLTTELGYPTEPAEIAVRLNLLRQSDRDCVLVAEEDGIIAGWVQAHLSTTLESGRRMEIEGLIISRLFRRKGIGKLLVEAAETWSRKAGAEIITVRSNINRLESHDFYSAIGFRRVKTQAVYRKGLLKPNVQQGAEGDVH